MPQFELQDFAPQLIWLTISFVALYFIMARVALPRIATVIEERRDRIASDLDQAEQLKQKTDAAIAAYEEALATARAKALGIAQETREALAAEVDAEKARAEKQIAEKTAEAEKRIAESKSDALTHINEVAGEVAGAIIKELIDAKASKSEVNQAVSKALVN
ncbi:ATP synthase subunit b 2 [bacterium BMS3Bbin10]|nr:ATP synthase subunit b 2 [bacterium BMS3Bbin10]